jgi:hypothetical protein
MAIDFLCSQCRHTLRVPDETAGKQARCPQCGLVQTIPAKAPPSDEPQSEPPVYSRPSPPVKESSQYNPPRSPPVPYESYPSSGETHSSNPYQSPSQGGPGYYVPQPKTREEVRGRVFPPAIALLVVSSIAALLPILGICAGVIAVSQEGGDEEDAMVFAMLGFVLLSQLFVIAGTARMLLMKNYGLAIAAVIVAMLSGMCCWLPLPFAIWALVILLDSDTRSHFS